MTKNRRENFVKEKLIIINDWRLILFPKEPKCVIIKSYMPVRFKAKGRDFSIQSDIIKLFMKQMCCS